MLAAILVLAGSLAYRFINERPPIPRASRFQPEIEEFRRLTAVGGGPGAIRRLRIADSGHAGNRVSINSFQLVYGQRRNRSTIVIDAGLDARLHREFNPGGEFYPDAYERLQQELLRATAIYCTRESYEHVGGISRSAALYGIRDRVRFTAAQARSPELTAARFPPTVLEAMTTIACARACSPAPGIVLFPAPGDAPGAQWIYIRDARRREFLLLGERTISYAEIERLQPRRSLSYWRADRDAQDIAHRLRALHDLMRAQPELTIVPVHDEDRLSALIAAGFLGDGFEYDSPFGAR